jgi:Flp pilus assembly protein TadD
MELSKLGQIIFAGTLALSPQLSGQRSTGGYIPAERAISDASVHDQWSSWPPNPFEHVLRSAGAPSYAEGPGPATSSAGTVSVEQLRRHLSVRGQRLIESGRRFAQSGDHVHAIEVYKQALNDPASAPYAQSQLAVEYLKSGDSTSAIDELTKSLQYMPGMAINHSNLGYAFLLNGQRDAAETELREAIKLDNISPQPRYLLGLILLDQRSEDAGRYLRFAQQLIAHARLALAVFHTRHGESDVAEQDLRAYLGPKWSDESAGAIQWVNLAAKMDRPSQLFGFPARSR